jgi:hypothetical protein
MVGPAHLQRRGLRCELEGSAAQSRMQEAGRVENVRLVGLDVHARSIVIIVAERAGSAAQAVVTIRNEMGVLLRHSKRLAKSGTIRGCCEARLMGFTLCSALLAPGNYVVLSVASCLTTYRLLPQACVELAEERAVSWSAYLIGGAILDQGLLVVPDATIGKGPDKAFAGPKFSNRTGG